MKIKRGVQFFTTGNPDRSYWFNGKNSENYKSKTRTISTKIAPVFIEYLEWENGNFNRRYAWSYRIRTGSTDEGNENVDKYIASDGKIKTKAEFQVQMNLYEILKRKPRHFSEAVKTVQSISKIPEEVAKAELGWLILEGAVSHLNTGRLTTKI